MFTKLKYLPLSLSPWSVMPIHPSTWLESVERELQEAGETPGEGAALVCRSVAEAPVPSPGECVNCLLFPYEEK